MFSLYAPDGTQGSKAVHAGFVGYFTSLHLSCPSGEINKQYPLKRIL